MQTRWRPTWYTADVMDDSNAGTRPCIERVLLNTASRFRGHGAVSALK